MSALDELNKNAIPLDQRTLSPIEFCIVRTQNVRHELAEAAAEQLATLETNCANAIQANIEVAKLNAALQDRIEYLEGWKIAIDDACINDWVSITTPKETVNNLIVCNVQEALDPLISEKPAKWVAEISELKENIKAVEANYDALQSPMPCGHLARYAVNEEAGTQYCAICVLDATNQTIANLVMTDVEGTDEKCPFCKTRAVLTRVEQLLELTPEVGSKHYDDVILNLINDVSSANSTFQCYCEEN